MLKLNANVSNWSLVLTLVTGVDDLASITPLSVFAESANKIVKEVIVTGLCINRLLGFTGLLTINGTV